jgi:predicted GIY-YIG superfamily endonuclease
MKPRYRRMLRGMKAGEAQVPTASQAAAWFLYILKCSDGSYYTGVTNDLERRLRAHQEGKASRYTRTRRPVVLLHQEPCGTRAQALSRECAVKAMSRKAKEELAADGLSERRSKRSGSA